MVRMVSFVFSLFLFDFCSIILTYYIFLSQTLGKIVYSQLVGPINRGLIHNPERYAAVGIRPESPYPGLYVGGSDLTVGDSYSASIVGGWLAANAVMGYSSIDHLFLQKNITSDIIQFLEEPENPEEDDLAVPYESTIEEASHPVSS